MNRYIRITEYLCDHCDSVFKSPLLVQQHQQKSCIGVTNKQKDDLDQWKKIKYIETMMASTDNQTKCERCGIVFIERGLDKTVKDWKEWKEWKEKHNLKGIKCIGCQEDETVLKMVEDGHICCQLHYVKKYH